MKIEDVIKKLENDPQLNAKGIKHAIEPLRYVMPLSVGTLYHGLDDQANTTGVVMSLKKIQEEYNNLSCIGKFFEGFLGEYIRLQQYRSINPNLTDRRFM